MSLKCACSDSECQYLEQHKEFLYRIPGQEDFCSKEDYYKWVASTMPCSSKLALTGKLVQMDDYINWDEQDKAVAESGFLRKPRKDEVYIKFTQDITPLERLTIHAVIFNALKIAFPNSHIGNYEE